MKICVFGASSDSIDPIYFSEAFRLGELLGQGGHTLIFGGGKGGLMGAAARGAHSCGGEIIGIAPRFFDEPGILFEECTEFIYTETMRERKALMEDKCDGFIVLPGGTGTYEEFFEVFTLKQLGRMNKPIVFLNTDGYYDAMASLMAHTAEKRFMSAGCMDLFTVCASPEDALNSCVSYDGSAGSIRRLQDYGK